jgi:predicted nucleic acid-binding protein
MANFLEDHYLRKTVVSYAINEDVILNARQVIESIHITNAADALHVLIANRAQCAYFISADKELNAAIKANGLDITVIDVHEPSDTDRFFDEIK